MKDLVGAIKKYNDFLICMHVDPDGDTIGSACALSLILEKLQKQYKIYSPDSIPQIYSFIKNSQNTVKEPEPGKIYGAVIAVDCGDIRRIAGGAQIKELGRVLINIDHHEDNTLFGDINHVKKASSTGEIIYDLAGELDVKIDTDIANALYAAIITDTGSFRYNNTTAKVFEIARDLTKCGISPNEIANRLYDSRTMSEIKMLGRALEKIESFCDGSIAVIALTNDDVTACGATPEEMRGIVDHIRSLKDVEIAIFMRETEKNRIKINFRSKTFDIQKIAKALGGGGHKRASGVILEGSLDEVKNKVIGLSKSIWTGS